MFAEFTNKIDDLIPFEIPNTWEWIRLGTVGESNIGLTYKSSDITNSKGILVLRSGNIQNGKMSYCDNLYVSCEVPQKAMIYKNDLLICARNGSRSLVGKCAIVDIEKASFGAFMTKFSSEFNPYIKIFLYSPTFRNQLDNVKTETINQITQKNLQNQLLPLPPFEEQIKIVNTINKIYSILDC